MMGNDNSPYGLQSHPALLTQRVNWIVQVKASCGPALKPARIDPLLDIDMSLGFQLKIPFFRVGAVIVFQGALNIHRMRVVAFDQVAR